MEFVQEYTALRWAVVVAFLVAATMVIGRLAAPAVGVRESAGQHRLPGGWPDDATSVDYAGPQQDSLPMSTSRIAYHESDAAHLIMCLVMLAMLVFPAGANPHAMRGVLTAMTVVFAALLVSRIAEWRTDGRGLTTARIVAIGYHVIAAAAMLYAMSGHSGTGHSGPASVPALALAGLFGADALAVLVALRAGRCHHWLGHPLDPADAAPSSAVVPHIVMDLGTAYMLVAAVLG